MLVKGGSFPAESELLSYSTGAILTLHWGKHTNTDSRKSSLIQGCGRLEDLI